MKPWLGRTGLVVVAVVSVAASVVSVTANGLSLTDTVAVHWGFDGTPNGTAPMWTMGVFVLAAAIGLIAVALSRTLRAAGTTTMLAGLAGFLLALYSGVLMMTASLNSGDDPTQVAGPSGWAILGLVAAGVAVGALTAWLASALPVRPEPAIEVPALDLPASSVAVWSRSLTARWAVAVAVGIVAAGAVMVPTLGVWLGVLVMLAGAATSVLSHIEVFADRRGLTVRYGAFGWPRTRIALDRIETAAPIEVTPTRWGGWGYRGSLAVFRRAAVVLRGGPGLRLDLTDGKVFVVTIDDPGTAAAVLMREVQGSRSKAAS